MKKTKRRVYKRRYYHNGKRCSRGEKRIACILENFNIKFKMEKTFDDCRSPKGNHLRFDFYLYELNVLIEFQGHHHYAPVNDGRRAKYTHDKTVLHDSIKKSFIIENQIVFIEIPHWKMDEMEDILKRVLNGSIEECET